MALTDRKVTNHSSCTAKNWKKFTILILEISVQELLNFVVA